MALTNDELELLGILPWETCKAAFANADLFLGNGFSINLHSQFRYPSLFDRFLTACSGPDVAIFQAFKTTNFEEIQRELLSAKKVADILGVTLSEADPIIAKLQDGLISVIHGIHPRFAEMPEGLFERLSEQFDQFYDVFTTNYDLFLYHIIMASNDRRKKLSTVRPYQDFFWQHWGSEFLEFMDYQNISYYKHAFYLHGGLFLFPGHTIGHYNTVKLKRRSSIADLLQTIQDQIKGSRMPLFVSEGTWQRKLNTIRSNAYLSFAMERFQRAREHLVIYGGSLAPDYDQHILDALNKKKRRIAISLYIGDKDETVLKAEMHTFRARLAAHDVWFFDAGTLFRIS